jgi:hypothetical protein
VGGKAVIATLQKPGRSDRVHTATKLAAVIDTVVAEGVSLAQALAGVRVSPAELLSPDTRVSLQQVLIACSNAIRLSRDPSLGFRAGASMHISAYGMYGFAILSSADFRKTAFLQWNDKGDRWQAFARLDRLTKCLPLFLRETFASPAASRGHGTVQKSSCPVAKLCAGVEPDRVKYELIDRPIKGDLAFSE